MPRKLSKDDNRDNNIVEETKTDIEINDNND